MSRLRCSSSAMRSDEVEVERVVVREERARGRRRRPARAAPASSTSTKPRPARNSRIAATRAEADLEHPAGVVVGDEVDVALAEAGVDVGEAVPLSGSGRSAFESSVEARDLDARARPSASSSPCPRRRPSRRGRGRRTRRAARRRCTACETNSCTAPVPSRSVAERELALAADAAGAGRRRGRRRRSRRRRRGRRTRRAARPTVWSRSKRTGYGLDPAGPQRFSTLANRRARTLRRSRPTLTRFRSKMIRRPRRVSHGSWCWIVRECGMISSARPPVAIDRALPELGLEAVDERVDLAAEAVDRARLDRLDRRLADDVLRRARARPGAAPPPDRTARPSRSRCRGRSRRRGTRPSR